MKRHLKSFQTGPEVIEVTEKFLLAHIHMTHGFQANVNAHRKMARIGNPGND